MITTWIASACFAFIQTSLPPPSDTIILQPSILLRAQRLSYPKITFNGSVNVLEKKQLSMPLSRTLPEAMLGISGLYVQRTNLGGGSVFMRGLTGNQVLIMIDGIRMNNAIYRYGPNQYLNTINLFDVNSVETFQGSGSVLYGSDALGGTINVITNSASFTDHKQWKPFGQLRIEFPTLSLSAHAGSHFSSKQLALTLSGTYRSFGNVQPGANKPLQVPSGYQEFSNFAKLNYQRKKSTWTLANQRTLQLDVPNYYRYALESYREYRWLQQGRMLSYLRNTYKPNPELTRTITIAHHAQWEDRSYRKKNSDPLTLEDDLINSFQFNTEWKRDKSSGWRSVYSIELYQDRVNSKRTNTDSLGHVSRLRGLYPQGATQTNVSTAAIWGKRFKQLNVNAGLRLSLNNLVIPDAQIGSNLIPQQIKDWQMAYSGTLSAGRKFNECYWYAAINSGFRNPNVDDLGTLGLVDFRYEKPAYALNPERNINIEQGLNYSSAKLQLHVSAFINELYGLINRVKVAGAFVSGYQVYEKVNTGKSRVIGTEWSMKYLLTRGVLAQFQGSWQKGDVLAPGKEPMRRIPPLNGSMSFEWSKGSWHSGLMALASAKQQRLAPGDISDNRIGPNGTKGFFSTQIWVSKTMKNGMLLNVAIQNLNNACYKTHGSGIWMPGRCFRLLLSF